MQNLTNLKEKTWEAASSVLPIILLVSAACFTIVPISPDLMLSFFIGAILLIVGMSLFTLRAETAMSPIGRGIGTKMTKSKNLLLILGVSFALGIAITISEPDLQVLAINVPHIDSFMLVITVALGVGFFLMLSQLRILMGIPLKWMLLVSYLIVFVLAAFSDVSYLSVAFDSGGVTTGPMTVPFIMAVGMGVAMVRSDKNAEADSFGLVGLCSIGPIMAVMLLGIVYKGTEQALPDTVIAGYESTTSMTLRYLEAIPHYMWEVLLALAPILVFFLLFQVTLLKLERRPFLRILIGILYTYVGLVLFLVGVNVGFSPLGSMLGETLTHGWRRWLLIPFGMLMGWFVITAEPAVHVLNKQVEEVSSGAISSKAMGLSLSIAIAAAVGLAMVRVLTGLPILYFLIPGYFISLVLTFFVPPIFTAIAFDSGGVASGPMAATFMLPFAVGASTAVGGNILTDAFGLVAMVAMMPLITIQIMGLIYVVKTKRREAALAAEAYDEHAIIELWEGE